MAVEPKETSWERKHVQHVLDFHNKKYGTHIVIRGKTQEVYPQLKGKSDWDWVCRDTETNEGIAVEVKRLTDEMLEVRHNTIRNISEEIQNDLSGKLPGTFFLSISIPPNYHLPFKGQQDRQKFKDVLCEAIIQTAQALKLGEDSGLISQMNGKLPFALPHLFSCDLKKYSDEGSALCKSSGITGFWSPKLDEQELEKFDQLVSHANEQLKLAILEFNVKKTILVVIDEGLRITNHDTIPEAFKSISRNSYSHIGHAYCVSGEEVTEIPLPTP